jgi:hypothetical protein
MFWSYMYTSAFEAVPDSECFHLGIENFKSTSTVVLAVRF